MPKEVSSGDSCNLTDEELAPILSDGFQALFGHPMTPRDLAENLVAVRAGHWAPGLSTVLGGSIDVGSVGLDKTGEEGYPLRPVP